MGNNGLHKLYGAVFSRLKTTLCPTCKHLEAWGAEAYEKQVFTRTQEVVGIGVWCDGLCLAKRKALSAPVKQQKKHRCEDYQRHPDADYFEWVDCEQFDPERYWWHRNAYSAASDRWINYYL